MLTRRAVALAWHALRAACRLTYRLAANRLPGRREAPAGVRGRTLGELFEALGPTYVKLGQILSTRRDLLSEPAIRHLELLQDRLPPLPRTVVAAAFKEEFGVELEEAFSEFDPSAVASASIASVYRARLRDGRLVAVKVRRPHVGPLIHADLRLARLAARLASRLPALRYLPLACAVEEFGACLERQLDFRLEAAANKRLRAALAAEGNLVIPNLVDEFCGSSVLTMEFIDGFCAPSARHGDKARDALRTALRALYRMIFIDGLVHCDMHYGNLRLLQDGRAALVDFGFVAELRYEDQLDFAEFFYAMTTNNGTRCAEITLDTAAYRPPDLDYEAFESEIASIVNRVSGARAGSFHVAEFVLDLFDVQRRHRVRGTTAFTMAIVSLLVLEGIAREVNADLDFQREAYPFIFRISLRPYRPETRPWGVGELAPASPTPGVPAPAFASAGTSA